MTVVMTDAPALTFYSAPVVRDDGAQGVRVSCFETSSWINVETEADTRMGKFLLCRMAEGFNMTDAVRLWETRV